MICFLVVVRADLQIDATAYQCGSPRGGSIDPPVDGTSRVRTPVERKSRFFTVFFRRGKRESGSKRYSDESRRAAGGRSAESSTRKKILRSRTHESGGDRANEPLGSRTVQTAAHRGGVRSAMKNNKRHYIRPILLYYLIFLLPSRQLVRLRPFYVPRGPACNTADRDQRCQHRRVSIRLRYGHHDRSPGPRSGVHVFQGHQRRAQGCRRFGRLWASLHFF